MNEIKNYDTLKNLINSKETFVLYGHAQTCGVCDVFMPMIDELGRNYNMPIYKVSIEELPEIRGQLSIFTVPLIALFYEGREYHRQARFIDMEEVKKRMKEIIDNYPDR